MFKHPLFYLVTVYLILVGVLAYFWLDRSSESPENAPSIRSESEMVEPPHLVALIPNSPLSGAPEVIPVEPDFASASLEQPQVERTERFTNEFKLRELLAKFKEEATADTMSDIAYEAYMLDLEELMIGAHPHYAEVWAMIQAELGTRFIETLNEPDSAQSILADAEKTFGFVWGQAEPTQSLRFARQAGSPMLAGWLAGQIDAENDYPSLLAAENFEPTPEVYWEALMDVAKTDTILSLDTILANHMETMDLAKWKEMLFSKGNSDDAILAAWFQENISRLSQYADFDEIEVVRMLRRYDYGEGPFMLSGDVARVEAAKAAKDFEGTARILEELSALYGDTIDASAAGRFPLDWSKRDFAAASEWLLKNSDNFSDSESFGSMLGTMYRHKALKDPATAVAMAHQIEDEALRGLTLSNTVIPQMEKLGIEAPVEWVSDLPQGFAKQRSMAGYVLGLSRHSEENTLEAQVKFQFLQDVFDLEVIQSQVLDSKLSNEEKISVVNLLNTY